MRWARMLGAARRRGRRAVVHVDVCKCTYHRMHYSYWRLPARDARLHHTQRLTNGPSATTNCIKCARDNYSVALMLHFIMDCSACRTATRQKTQNLKQQTTHTGNDQERAAALLSIDPHFIIHKQKNCLNLLWKISMKCIQNIKDLFVFSP
jgi:hypothetical protein